MVKQMVRIDTTVLKKVTLHSEAGFLDYALVWELAGMPNASNVLGLKQSAAELHLSGRWLSGSPWSSR
jgi:hypothetical protein